MPSIHLLGIICLLFSCSKNAMPPDSVRTEDALYFPDQESEIWATTSMGELNWNTPAALDLYDYLSENRTRAFIILHKGKIVTEKYWGENIQKTGPFDKNSQWYWASAGKTLTAFLTGLAQQQKLLNINDKTSNYLGKNWTSMPIEKENQITIRHQLTMTTGLDFTTDDNTCTTSDCLNYKVDPGTQWFYHNAPYTLLAAVLSSASKQSYNEFTTQQLRSKIGMDGQWRSHKNNVVYWSTARSAARFGLLLLSKGKWGDDDIMTDTAFLAAMTTPSQDLNPSYGFLTWLNGQSAIVLPGQTTVIQQTLAEAAPSDLFAAMGKNGQFINVVPGQDLVIVRMGEAPANDLVPLIFHNEMWKKIHAVIQK
ncbi:beta-lactamase family protein [Membranicola marinus]|uniref:Beta-lactamase family protein n=1 Tax=Membranihabitans marinus TaxID=1227546 RepID=A0A953L8D8_9BACT|nr:serine hydrolase [Membranihabitans marinus]MBY5957570.1 beta-lactamase family protein [Membranihabitans marinus]